MVCRAGSRLALLDTDVVVGSTALYAGSTTRERKRQRERDRDRNRDRNRVLPHVEAGSTRIVSKVAGGRFFSVVLIS